MYQLNFYVPDNHLEAVKTALFAAGAGQFQGYDLRCWQTLGQGQFRPLADSQPYRGEIGRLETVAEYKVEMICAKNRLKAAVAALLSVHPYQQPAYSVHKILGSDDLS